MPDESPTATTDEAVLVSLAAAARAHSHAPYSRFHVGAALAAADGRVFAGCNVENASYGLTICAERVAVFRAVCEGAGDIVALAVSAEPAAHPCGACLQVLAEFADPDCAVIVAEGPRPVARYRLGELLPRAFSGKVLESPPRDRDGPPR